MAGMIHEMLNTKIDAAMTALSVALILPLEWADLAIKAVPALCATVYWIARYMDMRNKNVNNEKTKDQ